MDAGLLGNVRGCCLAALFAPTHLSGSGVECGVTAHQAWNLYHTGVLHKLLLQYEIMFCDDLQNKV